MNQKSLARNALFFVCYKILGAIFPLITVSYASQVLLANGVGKVSSAQNIVQYFVLIAALGIPNYGIREAAMVREDSKQRSVLFSELFSINFVSTTVCLIAYYLMISQLTIYRNEFVLYFVAGFNIFLNYFNVDWFYQGFEEYSYITKRSFVIKIISLILLFVFVRQPKDYINYALIYVFGFAGNSIINFINLKKYGIKFSLKEMNVLKHIKPVLVMLFTTVAIELYTLVDTTMITFMCDSENVAYYANSIKIVRLVITLVTAIGGVLLPRLSYYKAQGLVEECENIVNRVFGLMFFLLMPCGVGLFVLSESIVYVFFGYSFEGAIVTLRIASFLVYALGFSNLFGTQVLLTFGEEKKLFHATVCGAVSNIILNSLLIRIYQQNGAAVASIVSELLVTILTYYYARKHLRISIKISLVLKIIFSSILMGFCVIGANHIHFNRILGLVLCTCCGALAYLILNIIMKNEILYELEAFIKKKLFRR